MTTGTPTAELAGRNRRSARLALFRAFLALAYLTAELSLSPSGLTRTAAVATGLFMAYSIALLVYHSHSLVREHGLVVLFLDLTFLLWLVFGSTSTESAGVAAIFYAFLVLESWSLHGAREVILLATAVTLVLQGARLGGGQTPTLVVTANSVLFLLVVGGLLAFLFSDQQYLVERRILALSHQTASASETATVGAMRAGLKELANWFQCSHAMLAFWDERYEHFCLCRYPPPDDGSRAATPELEDSREWAVFLGEQLTFVTNQVRVPENGNALGGKPAPKPPGSPEAVDYDLHAHLVRKYEINNAVGCGLYENGQAIGRLLLINRVSPMPHSLLRRLKRVAPAFAELARHILVIKAAEHSAYERERHRVAQDFHDGPLQSVISFQMRVHTIRKLLQRDPAAAARELEQLQELAEKQVTEMRTFVKSMRPVEMGAASLTAAARRLADDFQKESGVPVTFMGGDEPVSAVGKTGVDVLQIIREALNNIRKHAQATHVLLSLEKADNHLLIAINDNGKGFRFGGKYTLDELELLRLGPNSIKQRMRALGGEMLLESQPGHGTTLRLKIPLY